MTLQTGTSKEKAFGFIFARGGSKGIPRKNLALLDGVPLIGRAIEQAKACPSIARVFVSTDDAEIASVAREYGAETPFMRPEELATDTAAEWLAWQHAVREVSIREPFSIFVSLPTTSPLRETQDIEACIAKLAENDFDIVLTATPAKRNPYFNMISLSEDGKAQIMIKPTEPIHGRQSAPKAYDVTTVAYVARTDYILNANSLFEGCVGSVIIPQSRALDIDDPIDLEYAEFLLSRTNL